jgi:hypothetical protein
MSEPYARVRVRRDQADMLYGILFRERSRLIQLKIAARDAGEDTAGIRADLVDIKYLMEEAQRAMRDIDDGD